MILYVPFSRNEAGDLVLIVEQWKLNHKKNFEYPLHLIFYRDDFNFEKILDTEGRQEIFIVAHGLLDESSLLLANNSDPKDVKFLNIESIAARFNSDFLYIDYQIDTIHCYCCGSETKNKAIAMQLREHLLRRTVAISSYSGLLCGADDDGKLWSFNGSQKKLAKDTSHTISKADPLLEEITTRVAPKSKSCAHSYDDFLEKRRHLFFEAQTAQRKEKLIQLRGINNSAPALLM